MAMQTNQSQRFLVLVLLVLFLVHSTLLGVHGFSSFPKSQPSASLRLSPVFVHKNDAKSYAKPGKRSRKKKNSVDKTSKQEMNELIKNIGLQPVVHNINSSSAKKKPKLKHSSSVVSEPKSLSLKTQLQYARKGHTDLRNIIPPTELKQIKKDLINYSCQKELEAWQQKVEVALHLQSASVSQKYRTVEDCHRVLKNKSTDGTLEIPFLQHFNTWRDVASVRSLVTSVPLTMCAKTLLDVPTVKLYQDSLFHKRENDGPTPWHSDARMAPFDTSKMITFWIPLDYIPAEAKGGTGLVFVNGSHSDFALPFWNKNNGNQEGGEYDRLDIRYGGDEGMETYMPMRVGDMTAHAGWTLHSASGGDGSGQRYALAVTYVDAKAEVREDAISSAIGHHEDRKSFDDWITDVDPRCYFEHPLVPTL